MNTPSFAEYVECLDRQDIQGIADLMLESARKLSALGVDFLICPDNTIHCAFGVVVSKSPRPWLHIAAVVAEEAVSRGFRRIGLTGTRWLVESTVYPDQFRSRGLELARPAKMSVRKFIASSWTNSLRGLSSRAPLPTFRR